MILHHPEICLFQPEIPQNTGTIARLAAATQCRLHLIAPFGFSTEDKQLLRPGLDYWPFVDLEVHPEWQTLRTRFAPTEIAFFSKKGMRPYTEMEPSTRLLVFGRETSGLPETFWREYSDRFFSIPIFHPGVRSLNIANAVSIVVYHALLTKGLHVDHTQSPDTKLV
jgi:tRNA (cytidine/uridine-2'-O-)-methyltransferase